MLSVLILKLVASLGLFVHLEVVMAIPLKAGESVFPILMPRVKPTLPSGESYLCTAVEADPERTLYVTAIEPSNLAMEISHHMMLVGCSNRDFGGINDVEPEKTKNLWNCGGSLGENGLQYGSTCQGGEMQVLYMWSGNGSGIRFPEDSGMPIGGPDSRIQLLVLQVHYIHNNRIPEEGDSSGVVVRYTDTIQPFAFLTHTHGKGIHASGWVVRNNSTWTSIGMRNPQDPQSFYPAEADNLNISSDDVVAARCILRSDEDEVILQGLTSKMEMCDYFILYTTSGPVLRTNNSCTTKANFTWDSFGLINDPFRNLA